MDWREFTDRLASTLVTIGAADTEHAIIITDTSRPANYIQFLTGTGHLHGELATGKKYRPKESRLTKDDFAALKSAGWSKPINRGQNWWSESNTADSRELADRCARGLRDILGTTDPSTLSYRAFPIDGVAHVPLPQLGLPAEPPPD